MTAGFADASSELFLGFSPSKYMGKFVEGLYSKIAGEEFSSVDCYDGCMRKVDGLEVVDDGVIVEDFGGYWRTAERPKGSYFGSMNSKYLANYGAGEPVEASDEDLITAQNLAVEAVSELYRNWLEEDRGHDGVEISVEEL